MKITDRYLKDWWPHEYECKKCGHQFRSEGVFPECFDVLPDKHADLKDKLKLRKCPKCGSRNLVLLRYYIEE